MRLRNKIILSVIITGIILFSIGIGVSFFLMSQYPTVGDIFENNPLAALETASRIAVNRVTSTPTKSFNIEDADKDYNKTVEFSENRLELETAEEIIEWSVTHQSQPWVENITEFLQESQIPVGDITLHLVFINTKSGDTPVITVTYLSSNNMQIIEKGWKNREIYNAYIGLVTEKFAVKTLKNYSSSKLIVKAIMQNYDGAIKLTKE